MKIDWESISQLYPRQRPGVLVAIREILISKADWTTKARLTYGLAQLAHETGGFQWLREIGGSRYLQRYEGRRDLGNINPGDGVRYCGRGLIHLTGRNNYQRCADGTGLDCINHPELLEQPEGAAISAAWYWTDRNLNAVCDQMNFTLLTRRINGGLNGLSARQARLRQVHPFVE